MSGFTPTRATRGYAGCWRSWWEGEACNVGRQLLFPATSRALIRGYEVRRIADRSPLSLNLPCLIESNALQPFTQKDGKFRFREIWISALTDSSWPIAPVRAPRRNVRCRGGAVVHRREATDRTRPEADIPFVAPSWERE